MKIILSWSVVVRQKPEFRQGERLVQKRRVRLAECFLMLCKMMHHCAEGSGSKRVLSYQLTVVHSFSRSFWQVVCPQASWRSCHTSYRSRPLQAMSAPICFSFQNASLFCLCLHPVVLGTSLLSLSGTENCRGITF